MYTKERNDFIYALNVYFGFEVSNMDDFKEDFQEEFEYKQGVVLMDFLFWYERKLNKK
jgi:hypothetical protein